jgi:RNA polymerase sigma factor (sigma-70 family)
VKEPATVSSAEDVVAVEPVIRRVVAARVTNPSDIDDLVQDCLERLLGAHRRLAPETVLPFGIVTARNLVASHSRTAARRAAAAPLIADPQEPDRPEDTVLASEAASAMETAVSRLSPEERADILSYYGPGPGPGASETQEATGALRVRIARIRAKLRLEYLLAFRRIELPAPQCRRVLLAISAGDTRRQRELDAGRHLLDCGTCAALSEPLSRRSVALTALTFPAALTARALAKARAHPVQATASTAAGTAAVAAAVIAGSGMFASSPAPVVHPAASPAPLPTISGLAIGERAVSSRRSIRAAIGERARASGVAVESAVTRNGFWVGSPRLRVWVELTGPLEPLHIAANSHLDFDGTVTGNGSGFPVREGVSAADGAALLNSQGAHIEVRTTDIRVERNS